MKFLTAALAFVGMAYAQTDCFASGTCPQQVYTMTNQGGTTINNELIGFPLNTATGAFTAGVAPNRLVTQQDGGFDTAQLNNGAAVNNLLSQDSIDVSEDGSRVFFVNGRSNTWNFAIVAPNGALTNGGAFNSGGVFPQSIAFDESEERLYVLNNGMFSNDQNAANDGHVLAFFDANAQRTNFPFVASQVRFIPYGLGNNQMPAGQPSVPDATGVSQVGFFPDNRVIVLRKNNPAEILLFSEVDIPNVANDVPATTATGTTVTGNSGILSAFAVDPSFDDGRIAVAEQNGAVSVFSGAEDATILTLQGRAALTALANRQTNHITYSNDGSLIFATNSVAGGAGTLSVFSAAAANGAPALTMQAAFTLANSALTDLDYEADEDDEFPTIYMLNPVGGNIQSVTVTIAGAPTIQSTIAVTNNAGATQANSGLSGLKAHRGGDQDNDYFM